MNVTDVNLIVHQGVQKHFELKGKINDFVRKLNDKPDEIDPQLLRELISELVKTNRELEAQKQGVKKTCWNRKGEMITNTLTLFNVVGGIILVVITIFQLVPSYLDSPSTNTTQPTCTPVSPDIATSKALQAVVAFFILSAALVTIGGIGSYFAAKKNKKEKEIQNNLDRVMNVQQIGEECLYSFLKALEEFKSKPPEERNEVYIQKCIRAIDKIPKNGTIDKIKKENLVPHMIEQLPPDNPLFVNYAGLKESANEPVEEDLEEVSFGESSSATLSLPSLDGLKAKAVHLHRRFPHHQRQRWSLLENTLGVKLSKIKIDGKYLHKDGRIENIPLETVVDVDPIGVEFDATEMELVGRK